MSSNFPLAFRSLRKNKGITLINILGLSIGITACLVIYLIAAHELNYDRFHPGRDRIYRVYTHVVAEGFTSDFRYTYMAAVAMARDHVTGLEAVTHLHNWYGKVTIENGRGQSRVFEATDNFAFAGPEFFNLFSAYKWLVGNPESSLREPWQVVLTERRARRYFGAVPLPDLIGREIVYQDTLRFRVSGVVADLEGNTDFTFTDFTSYATCVLLGGNKPFSFDEPTTLYTGSQLFVKVGMGVTPEEIAAQLNREEEPDADRDGFAFTPMLQPLGDLHFNKALGLFEVVTRHGPKKSTVYSLIGLAVALVLIAAINFINLATAQASKRAKEVGVKKVLGCSHWRLMCHFLAESFLLTFISVIASLGLSYLVFIYFEAFIPPGVTLDLIRTDVIAFLVTCLFGVSLLAGAYPAFVLSSYRPALALKKHIPRGSGMPSPLVRRVLSVFQFSFAQLFIIGMLVVGMQIRYMLDKDLGFTTKAVIAFHAPKSDLTKMIALRDRLSHLKGVEVVAIQSQPPSGASGGNSILLNFTEDENLEHWVNAKFGDIHYLDLYGLELMAGRNFDERDSCKGYIINEAYLKKLGFTNPRDVIGIVANGVPVIGVVKDYHTESLHTPIRPTVIVCDAKRLHSFGVKLRSSEQPRAFQETLAGIEDLWKQVYPGTAFAFAFIDDRIQALYESEQRVKKLVGVATGIAILISCLGLFALSSFTALERTKEIGIRKVMGASVGAIVGLLSFEVLKLVLLAFVLAAPFAYYLSNNWLNGFAFRIDLGVWIFGIAAVLSLLLALMTIGYHTAMAAWANPVDSLRHE